MTAQSAIAKTTAKPAVAATERGYLNGSAVDGHTIETLARAPDVIDPEPVDEAERFETPQDAADFPRRRARTSRRALTTKVLDVHAAIPKPPQAVWPLQLCYE